MKKKTRSSHEYPLEKCIANGIKGAKKQGHRVYTPEEDDFIIQHFHCLNQVEIAQCLGRKTISIYNRLKKLRNHGRIKGNSPFRVKKFTRDEDRFITEHRGDLNTEQVGDKLGRSKASVLYRAMRLGVSYRKIGIEAPQGKLTLDDVELIRALSDEGLSSYAIADKFGVRAGYVRSIVNFNARLYQDIDDFVSHRKRQFDSIDGRN
ncbi:DNA-binding protein [Vibrio diazotrophicus]|uniref:DNA-binding protein n=1 Tax=Vibrio diazotrophicus TaxID=685 RepID=UPI0021558EA5|nr:DNA-binding protein [Vibrio diazotrophicus]